MSQSVVITGYGALASTGNHIDGIWENIKAGNTGIAPIQYYDTRNWEFSLGGELKDFNPRQMLTDKKLLKVISRQDVIGLNAAQQAIDHSGLLTWRDSLSDQKSFNDRTGVYIASPGIKFNHLYELLPLYQKAAGDIQEFGKQLFDVVHPMWLLRILSNNVLAYVGIQNNFKGPNHNIPNHGISGTQAIAEAAHAIRNGQMDRAVVVGYDTPLGPQEQMYYGRMGTLSATGLRPFNRDHDGTILAEAGAALMLESLESAKTRGANIYAEIMGDAFSNEAKGIFTIDAHGEGVSRMLIDCLERAAVRTQDIGMIAAHGNGNPMSDDSEVKAIKAVFGVNSVPVTAYKWSTGHTIAAAGVLEIILTLKALAENIIPGIATLTVPANEAEDLNISSEHRTLNTKTALCMTRGFASLNGALMLREYPHHEP